MADKLDKLLARMADPEAMEADRLSKMARVKPPRMYGDMAGDVTTGLGRTRKDMENIARGGAKKMKYGGKAQKMEEVGQLWKIFKVFLEEQCKKIKEINLYKTL